MNVAVFARDKRGIAAATEEALEEINDVFKNVAAN
jgi:hypothetical protein